MIVAPLLDEPPTQQRQEPVVEHRCGDDAGRAIGLSPESLPLPSVATILFAAATASPSLK
jgi:hypothetical protein